MPRQGQSAPSSTSDDGPVGGSFAEECIHSDALLAALRCTLERNITMKFVDATTYRIVSDEEMRMRCAVAKEAPEMVIYDLNVSGNVIVDLTLCSDERFLEMACNVLVIH